MSRFIKLSVAFLLTIGGTGIAFANSTNNYNKYDIPSSGSLGPAPISTDIASASFGFNPMPDAGFGPSTASLENSDSIFCGCPTPRSPKIQGSLVVRLWDWCASAPAAKPCPKGASCSITMGTYGIMKVIPGTVFVCRYSTP